MSYASSFAPFFVVYCAYVLFGEPPHHLKIVAFAYSIVFLAFSFSSSDH